MCDANFIKFILLSNTFNIIIRPIMLRVPLEYSLAIPQFGFDMMVV